MDAKELSTILNTASQILSLYGNTPIDEALEDILKIARIEKKVKSNNITKNKTEVDVEITDILIKRMSEMSSEELNKFLQGDERFQTRGALLKLAKTLSITTSTRNNVPTLSHSIIKFFERQKMDKFIREDRTAASPPGEEKI